MEEVSGTESWIDICNKIGGIQESKRIESLQGVDIERTVSGYFGNTEVLRDGNGQIVQLINYRPDHTMSIWKKGVWNEGRWLVNTGQDSSKVFHTFEIQGKPATWRHAFAANKKPGDFWINPETGNGIPASQVGAVTVLKVDGKLIIEHLDIDPGAYFSLEEGLIPAPNYTGEKFDFFSENLSTVGENHDKALEGYLDNTFYFINNNNQIVEVIYYNPDHTVRAWRDGKWVDGKFLLNNGQDNSVICQTRADLFNKPASWCHPFAPFKKPGDMWVAPESHLNGDPVYPLIGSGIPVVMVEGKNVIVGTDMVPRELYRIERGYVSLEELQKRDF